MTVTADGVFPNGASGAYFSPPSATSVTGLNPSAAGSSPGVFTTTPVMPAAANPLNFLVSTDQCRLTAAALTTCTGLGTFRVQLTDPTGGLVPVVAPKIHVTRLGGTVGSMELASGLQINAGGSTAGIGFAATGSATPTLAVTGGNEFFGNPNVAGTNLAVNCGASATTSAGCGTVQVTGNPATILMNVRAYRTTASPNAWTNGADAFFFDMSFDEDFGGAPTTYEGGGVAAAHLLTDLRLGSGVTAENTTTHNGTATGTGLLTASPVAAAAGAVPGDTQDALTAMPALNTSMIGSTYTVTPAISGASRGGDLCGWIDFDRSGTFSAAEGVCAAFAAGATSVPLTFTVPTATTAGATYARFRVTYDTNIDTANFNGLYSSGEVEDYQLQVMPAVRLVKALTPLPDSGTFNLAVNGTTFATGVGNGGTTGFRTVYHTGTPSVTVATDVATAAITGVTLSETGAGGTVLTNYATTVACVDGAGTAVTPGGSATAPTVTIPQSVTGASANGRAQTVTCTLTNTRRPSITLVKALGSNRVSDSDEFIMAIRTGGVGGSVVNSTTNSTTTGVGSTVDAGTGTTGTFTATAGTAYTLTETASGTTNFLQYNSTVTCTDSAGLQTGLPSSAAYNAASGLTITPVAGAAISCTITNSAKAPIISFTKALGSNRVANTDQATVAIRTGGVSGTVVNSTANSTTTGTGNTIDAGTGTTGAFTAIAGTAYTLTESASGTSNFLQYTAAITCSDSASLQTGLPSGTAYNMATGLTVTPVAGAVISCTITNTARAPTISLVKALGANRIANTDQFTMAIRTGGVSGTVVNSTTNSTTTGATNVVTAGTGATGTYTATSGTAYTLTESPSGTTNFVNYDSAITCTDSTGLQTGLPTGAAYSVATGTTITPVAGATIACTITNTGRYSDLVVTKTDGTSSVNAGGSTTYTVRVTNNGPSSVTGAILSDPAATGLSKTAVACSGTPGQCGTAPTIAQIEGGAFALPALASGEFYEVTIAANVTATSGTVANAATATVPVGTTDPNTANNTGVTDTNTVTPFPVLTLVKMVVNTGGGNASAGEWTLLATDGTTTISGSTGTSTVTNSSVPAGTYALSESGIPAGYDGDDYADSGYSCVINAGVPVVGNSVTLVHGDDATCTVTNTFVPDPQLTLTKQLQNGTSVPLVANQVITYQFIVTNTGNVTVSNVNIEETAFNGSGAIGVLSPPNGSVSLAPGTSQIFTATYTVDQNDVDDLQP